MHKKNPCSATVRILCIFQDLCTEARIARQSTGSVQRFLAELSCAHPIAAAHTAPPAKSVTPVMKIAVSNRVIVQLLRMARLNRWIVSELAWRRTVNEWLIGFTSAWGRIQGGNTAARDRHNVVSASVLNHLRRRRIQHSLALDAERLRREPDRYRSGLASNAVCRSLVEAPLHRRD